MELMTSKEKMGVWLAQKAISKMLRDKIISTRLFVHLSESLVQYVIKGVFKSNES